MGRCWRVTPATRSRPAESGCGRCSYAWRRARRRPRPRTWFEPRWRSSSSTARPSSTTTSSTAPPRAADLLDGTVTFPLIVARARDAELAAVDLRDVRTPADAAGVCDRIAATGALTLARDHALELVADAKATLPPLPDRQRAALELVADGVVERYV